MKLPETTIPPPPVFCVLSRMSLWFQVACAGEAGLVPLTWLHIQDKDALHGLLIYRRDYILGNYNGISQFYYRTCIFKWSMFDCYVSFRGCT